MGEGGGQPATISRSSSPCVIISLKEKEKEATSLSLLLLSWSRVEVGGPPGSTMQE